MEQLHGGADTDTSTDLAALTLTLKLLLQSKQPDDWQPPERVRDPWSIGGMLYRTVTNAWEWGLTPGAVIRMLGPWGPGTIQGYARRRWGALP